MNYFCYITTVRYDTLTLGLFLQAFNASLTRCDDTTFTFLLLLLSDVAVNNIFYSKIVYEENITHTKATAR